MNPEGLSIPVALLADTALRPAAKLVLGRLMQLARGGGLAFVSQSQLAGELGVSEEAAERALRALRAKGRIALVVSQAGRGQARGYRVAGIAPRFTALGPTQDGEQEAEGPRRATQLLLFDSRHVGNTDDGAREADHSKPLP